MSEPSDGGFTGDADGAPYTGYDPGPADQSSAEVPANPSGLSAEELQRLQESDKPIEYDPVGQALIGGVATGIIGAGEVVLGGAELAGTAIKEGVSWVASEVGIGIAEHVAEGGSEQEGEQPPAEYDQNDGGVTDQGAGYE